MTRRRPADVARQLDALYAELPAIQCRGACHDSCGAIDMTRAERRRIYNRTRLTLDPVSTLDNGGTCPALTDLKRCSIYPLRPMICRLWGLTNALQCSYGCVPDGGYLTEQQAYTFLARAAEISGDTALASRFRRVAALPDLNRRVWQARGPLGDIADAERDWAILRSTGSTVEGE